ncbi:nectin cell adhesion molecule 1b isoform X3 [Oryzias melastigma]|uniref:Nectin cell adhesion molecule 1b n=1 Tax=Oryzias melastigma TaxID=30732 RepID=A0A3B3B4F9_ORYME|nr:nectin cell adhesion molecule 1b isoform X3 [Oryzias melastigma]
MARCVGLWALLLALHVQAGSGQVVQMDSAKSGFVGSQVELRCIFVNSNPPVKVSQVTWQKLLNGTKQNVAIVNPVLGVSVLSPFRERVSFKQATVRHQMSSLEDTTIVFSNLQLSDEAAYICEYTTFPAGNRENMVNLTVYAQPLTRMSLTSTTIVAKTPRRKMTVATCTAANGKPPSVIKWETRIKGEATYQETRNQNGTMTVKSNYQLIPSREIHKQRLTCIVTYRGERISESVVLNVQYEPEVKIEGFDGNWYLNRQTVQLTCRADANPPVTIYQWKLLNGSLPSNVEIKNNTLFFKGPVTYDLAGTYVCDATNAIGTRTGIVDVNITDFPINQSSDPRTPQEQDNTGVVIGCALGGVALLGVLAILLFVFLRRRQRTFKGDYSTKKHAFGNGYSKAGGLPAHPSKNKNMPYPEDSDDEKKPTQIGTTGGFEPSDRNFDTESEDLKRPYFTVDEGESREYDERTLTFQYERESEIADDMISQTDGSVISKKEWYV